MLIAAVCPVAIFGQETESLPLPIVSARSIRPDTSTTNALTPAEEARLMLKNTFGARAVGTACLSPELTSGPTIPRNGQAG